MIGFGAAGSLALTITDCGGWIDRINHICALEELVHSGSLAGLDSHGQAAERRRLLAEAFPSFDRVVELEIGNDLALSVDNDHQMVISRPIKASVMGDLFPFFHRLFLSVVHRGAVVSHADTRSLVGWSSLRLRDQRRQTVRCTFGDLREDELS